MRCFRVVSFCRGRRQTKPGINIEGQCVKVGCPAFGNYIIDSRIQYGEFNVGTDKAQCPICYDHVVPATVGFTNCWWRFSGRKVDGEVYESGWERVGNVYKLFDGATQEAIASGQAKWTSLTLLATKFEPRQSMECLLCHYEMKMPARVIIKDESPIARTELTCGHAFHRDCIQPWVICHSTCPLW